MKSINDDFDLLIEIVGAKLAMKIVETFAGSSIYIPKNILTAKKHLEVLAAYEAGKSYRELILLSGYSESYIRAIVGKEDKINTYKQVEFFQTDFSKDNLLVGGSHEDD